MKLRKRKSMNKKYRLVVVQGPSQAISAISVLRSVDSQKSNSKLLLKKKQTIFLVGCLCAAKNNLKLCNATRQTIRALNYDNIICTNDLDKQYETKRIQFEDYVNLINKRLNKKYFSEVFVARRMAYINEAALRCSFSAKKICYGDGFGCFDNGFPNWAKPQPGNSFSDIDECRASIAFEENINGSLNKKITLQSAGYLKKCIGQSSKKYLFNKKPFLKNSRQKNNIFGLITTSNLLESGLVNKLSDEIELYLKNILHLIPANSKQAYLVKGHPRETNNQSKILAAELKKYGINCYACDKNSSIPGEIVISLFKPQEVIPLLSTVGYVSRLINPQIQIKYSDHMSKIFSKKNINRSFNWYLYPEKLQALTLLASYPWDRCVKFAKLTILSLLFRDLAITFSPVNPQVRKEKEEQFRAFRNSSFSMFLLLLGSRARRLQKIQSLIPA